jgi:hypothetical protein
LKPDVCESVQKLTDELEFAGKDGKGVQHECAANVMQAHDLLFREGELSFDKDTSLCVQLPVDGEEDNKNDNGIIQ